jgi:hypothetical protein
MANSGNRDFLASFTSASVSVFKDPDRFVAQLDVPKGHVMISAGGGCVTAPDTRIGAFLQAGQTHGHTLDDLEVECLVRNGPASRGRFSSAILHPIGHSKSAASDFSTIVIEDRLTGGALFLRKASPSEMVGRTARLYRQLRTYIDPCLRIARRMEPIEDREQEFLTVHGTARLSAGKVDFRPLRQIVQVHVLREYSLGGLCRRAWEVGR